ncbi:Large tegument protein deneddylase [Marek's disease herpesvirus type 1 strain MD5] [Rhizoctonia solani]|uniref:Large tegument protein deneddylase [Marek's disease herpesvirus type 1 strain MD5] n=1 Tax=Rhizoctonia solani TaxID=456999 RepID=A0A0K6G7M5_9AGAM|nr:Large tegument protein deneddylase [Marek's disease herpesvirus type 1 strain MD5] [Rhizoctonia solani]
MSESLGKPWIESSIVEILVDHAHELPSPAKLQTRAQIVKFLTFREDTGDGSQPKDRNTVLWAEITDGEWIIPVRIANEATNKIEDEYKRALTYYRRGFFTLKAAVSFGFVSEQIKSQIKTSSSKQLFLDIVELSYISGGGQGVPVATRAVALQTPPALSNWVKALNTGGKTLTNLQAQERATRDAGRASKANSRRLNAINANKKASNPTKTPAQSVTPQPLTDNLDAKRNWQEGWFGKRRKLREVNYIHPPEGFEPTDDQQAKFKAILERIRMATPANPYDPTSMDDDSSVPDRLSIPSTIRSSQVLRSSQAISSTPVDSRLPRNKPAGSQLRALAAADAVNASSDSESDAEDSNSDRGPVRSRQVSGPPTNTNRDRHSRFHIPTPRPSDLRADESHEEASPGVEGRRDLLEPDDAITEQVLSQAFAPVGQGKRVPTVLVPDSDPPNSSQHPTQVRHSSPWDCEGGSSSEHEDISCSAEATRHSPIKGQRRFSPALSLAQSVSASQDDHMGSQPIIQVTNGAKQGSSGQGESQPSAAASLPSPPPEDSNGYKLDIQPPDSVPSLQANAAIFLTQNLSDLPNATLRHDPNKDLIQQRGESSGTRPRVEKVTSRKRRLSQSPPRAHPPQELALSRGGRPVADKGHHRGSRASTPAHKNAPRQFNVGQEGRTNEPSVSSKTTKAADSNGYTDVIPHDREAWTNPSWMNSVRMPKQVKSSPTKIPHTPDARPLDKLHTGRIPRPSTGLRILQPPFHYPTPIAQRIPSPGFPPVTASQFADADEDSGIASSKVEPPTPARLTTKPVAWRPRISNVTQPVPTARGQTAVFTPGPSKQPRTSTKAAGNNVRVPQEHEHAVRRGEHNSEGQRRPKNAPTARQEVSAESSAAVTAQPVPSAAAHQPYLGGFQPSITVDLPRKYQWTWENWLEVTKDAYSFWLE